NGGSISTPAQPCLTACVVSSTVSAIEQQPVPGIIRDGSIPAATTASSNVDRSSAAIEFASLLVPNTASPQFCESNHWQCLMNRSRSGERSALKGVTTGASTPRMRLLCRKISVSSIVLLPTSCSLFPTFEFVRSIFYDLVVHGV